MGDEIVGVVRRTVKTLATGTSVKNIGHEYAPAYAKVAYILGLRVSPSLRLIFLNFYILYFLDL